MQYMQVTVPSVIIREILGCICVRWSTSEEMAHNVCGEELEVGIVNVAE